MKSPPPSRPEPRAPSLAHGTQVTTCDSLLPGRITMVYYPAPHAPSPAPGPWPYYRVQFPPRLFWSEWYAIYRPNEVCPLIEHPPLTNLQIVNKMRPRIPGAKP